MSVQAQPRPSAMAGRTGPLAVADDRTLHAPDPTIVAAVSAARERNEEYRATLEAVPAADG